MNIQGEPASGDDGKFDHVGQLSHWEELEKIYIWNHLFEGIGKLYLKIVVTRSRFRGQGKPRKVSTEFVAAFPSVVISYLA